MNSEPLVLTFDIGTQSCRAMLVRKDGSFAGKCQIKYDTPFFALKSGWAEQKPTFYFEKLCEASQQLMSGFEGNPADIIAVTVTTIRDTVICLDKNNKPLRNAIVWLDKREAVDDIKLTLLYKLLFKVVGMSESIHMLYRATVYNWLKQNQPEIIKKTAKYVMLPSYINFLLTGRLCDSYSNMIGHMPLDYKNKKWASKSNLTRPVADVPDKMLCELIEPGDTVGKIDDSVSDMLCIPKGLPLIASGSDKGCETLGLSVIHPGKAALSFGTTATVQITTKNYVEPQKFMPAYPAVLKDSFNPEIQIYSGYWTLTWFIREFCSEDAALAEKLGCSVEEVLNTHLKDIPAGCNGLVLQPYWTAGITIPNARGTITGFTTEHTRYHLYRAIIEGVGFALYEGMKNLEKQSKTPIKELYIAGGGSQSDEICQITADMFGLPVKRIHTHEASGIGSSMVAFVAKKEFSDFDSALKSMVHDKDTFKPDAAVHKTYLDIFNSVYLKLYPRLEPVFRNIMKLNRR